MIRFSVPRLSNVSVALLSRDLVAAAPKKGLPDAVKVALAEVSRFASALESARRSSVTSLAPRGDSAFVLVRHLRTRVATLRSLLSAHARAEELTSESRKLRAIAESLFDRNTAVRHPKSDELLWISEALVERTKDRKIAEAVDRIGGTPILKAIRAALIALTEERSRQVNTRPPFDPDTRNLHREALKAVRTYVELVEGAHRVGLVDGTSLLAPLANLLQKRRRVKDAPMASKPEPMAAAPAPADNADEEPGPASRAA